MGSLDTNILLRLLVNDIPEQHKAALNLVENSTGQLAIADTAVMEVVFVLERYYELERKYIAEALEKLVGLPKFNCNRALFAKSLPLFVNHSSLSFEDCCLSIYAELNNALPLWTFDKKLANQSINAKLLG